jgi:class 3 adenylate cyclase
MTMEALYDEMDEELSTILATNFEIAVTRTDAVPHSDDPAITFPNLDARVQRCKVIETAVLYIDIRRSTDLNLEHRAATVAKLYSGFVRAMTRCAMHYRGHVRGIIGDRVMVIFNPKTAFVDAVSTAILMNSAAKHLVNRHFKHNDVSCGIGIDYGRMLATKTGVRRHGSEQGNYRSLVWLGRPANVASKLTDQANKTAERTRNVVSVATLTPPNPLSIFASQGLGILSQPLTGLAAAFAGGDWSWNEVELKAFIERLNINYLDYSLRHSNPDFRSFYLTTATTTATTPPILMTEVVYQGYRKAMPDADSIKKGWWHRVAVSVPSYDGGVYGGNLVFPTFKAR